MKYAFIQQHKDGSVSALCKALKISRSGYYGWAKRKPSKRMIADQELLQHIRSVHQRYRQAYGATKTWRHLNHIGIKCGKHRVARLRAKAGIEAQAALQTYS